MLDSLTQWQLKEQHRMIVSKIANINPDSNSIYNLAFLPELEEARDEILKRLTYYC